MRSAPVYLDHAATTPVRPEAREAMLPFLGDDAFSNPSSGHQWGRRARAALEEARRDIARALGAPPASVYFTSGGTEADNLAVLGAALAATEAGRPMGTVVAATEHKAILAAAHQVGHLSGSELLLPVDLERHRAVLRSFGRLALLRVHEFPTELLLHAAQEVALGADHHRAVPRPRAPASQPGGAPASHRQDSQRCPASTPLGCSVTVRSRVFTSAEQSNISNGATIRRKVTFLNGWTGGSNWTAGGSGC